MPANRFVDKITGYDDAAKYELYAPTSKLFRTALSDGTDTDLTDNYSSATKASVTFTRPAVVNRCTIRFVSSTLAQNVVSSVLGAVGSLGLDGERFVGITALTNGLKFRVENSAGTVLLDISNTNSVKNLGQLAQLCSTYNVFINDSSATAGSNSVTFVGDINFKEIFGRSISVNLGDKFVCVLQDDFSAATITEFNITIAGFYL